MAWPLATLALVLSMSGCVVLGTYDFDGYRPSTVDAGNAPPVGSGGTSSGGGPDCIARTCADLRAECNTFDDGCGGMLDCGTCVPPATCGGADGAFRCGTDPCKSRTCEDLGASCGMISDGCGGTVNCGGCVPPATCGGGGISKTCGCTPVTCPERGAECGMSSAAGWHVTQ